jgi:hypothetical protein
LLDIAINFDLLIGIPSRVERKDLWVREERRAGIRGNFNALLGGG